MGVGVSIQGVAEEVVHIVPKKKKAAHKFNLKELYYLLMKSRTAWMLCWPNMAIVKNTEALYCIWRVILNAVKRQTVPWFSKRIRLE